MKRVSIYRCKQCNTEFYSSKKAMDRIKHKRCPSQNCGKWDCFEELGFVDQLGQNTVENYLIGYGNY